MFAQSKFSNSVSNIVGLAIVSDRAVTVKQTTAIKRLLNHRNDIERGISNVMAYAQRASRIERRVDEK